MSLNQLIDANLIVILCSAMAILAARFGNTSGGWAAYPWLWYGLGVSARLYAYTRGMPIYSSKESTIFFVAIAVVSFIIIWLIMNPRTKKEIEEHDKRLGEIEQENKKYDENDPIDRLRKSIALCDKYNAIYSSLPEKERKRMTIHIPDEIRAKVQQTAPQKEEEKTMTPDYDPVKWLESQKAISAGLGTTMANKDQGNTKEPQKKGEDSEFAELLKVWYESQKESSAGLDATMTNRDQANTKEPQKKGENSQFGSMIESWYESTKRAEGLARTPADKKQGKTNDAQKKAVVHQDESVPNQLREYKALVDEGVITEEEFRKKKEQLLDL